MLFSSTFSSKPIHPPTPQDREHQTRTTRTSQETLALYLNHTDAAFVRRDVCIIGSGLHDVIIDFPIEQYVANVKVSKVSHLSTHGISHPPTHPPTLPVVPRPPPTILSAAAVAVNLRESER